MKKPHSHRQPFHIAKSVIFGIGFFLLTWTSALQATTLPTGFSEVGISTINQGTSMAFAPDGRLFICQQPGFIRIVKNDILLPTPFLTIPVDSVSERGLLGITFDPNFLVNQYLYVYYTDLSTPRHNRVSRFTATGDIAFSTSEVHLMDLDDLGSAGNHNGGALHFGTDGKLYVAVGENANGANSQIVTNRLGKLLRINSDGSIPADNPETVKNTSGVTLTPTGANRAIWALGLRNPFTFDINPVNGKIFINDVGQGAWEEINLGIAGSNYGWPTCEGNCANSNTANPVYTYSHATGGCAITGGTFYLGNQFPAEYKGAYFFADFCGVWIHRLNPNGTVDNFADGVGSVVDIDMSTDGSLYYLTRTKLFKATYGTPTQPNQPPTISSLSNQTIVENTNTGALAFTIGDDQTPVGNLVLSKASSNTTLIPNGNIVLGGSGANRTVFITPTLNQSGSSTLILGVRDGVLTSSITFIVTVTPQNLPPTISAMADQTIAQNSSTAALPLTIGDSQTPVNNLVLTKASSNATLIANNNIVFGGLGANRTVMITATAQQSGFSIITLGVSDGVFTSSITFRLTVTPPNGAPTVSLISDQTINENSATGAIPFTIGDDSTPVGNLTISKTSSNLSLIPNANIVLGGVGANRTVTITPLPNQSGVSTINISVSDGSSAASVAFKLTVAPPNTAPTISKISNQTITENTATGSLPFTIGDAQTPVGNLVLTKASSNSLLVPVDRISLSGGGADKTVTVTPAINRSGQSIIVVGVSDGIVTSSTSFILTVTSINKAPSATLTLPLSSTLFKGLDVIPFSATAIDPEDGVLPNSAFDWEIQFHHHPESDPHHHFHPFTQASGVSSGSFTVPLEGETDADVWFRIILTVKDKTGLTSTVTRDVFPKTVDMTITTVPSGLQVLLDGQSHVSPFVVSVVVGMQRTIGVPMFGVLEPIHYQFESWSDGGVLTHSLVIPATNATFTANFLEIKGPDASGDASLKSGGMFSPTKQENFSLGVYLNHKSGRIDIYDRAGVLIRSFENATTLTIWDGRNQSGEIVSAGLYLAKNQEREKKLVIIK